MTDQRTLKNIINQQRQTIESLKRDNTWTHEANTKQTKVIEGIYVFAKELWEEYQLLPIPSKKGPVYRKVFDRLTLILGLETDWMLLAPMLNPRKEGGETLGDTSCSEQKSVECVNSTIAKAPNLQDCEKEQEKP